jgi:hypothetical protein
VDAELILTRAPYLEGQKSVVRIWGVPRSPGRNLQLGVSEDGVLRVMGYWGFTNATNDRLGRWRLIPASIQLAQETNWLALANGQDALVALKNDGTLWKLSFPTDPIAQPQGFSAASLSRHSDWVGLTTMMDRIVSLAADGSLWYWAMEDPYRYARGFTFQPLMAPSRRPQLIGNIFGSSGQ